jgi:hypothetical protein
LVPMTLTMYEPATDPTHAKVEFKFGSVVKVRLAGLSEHLSPELELLFVRVTVPVNVISGLTVMIAEPDTLTNIGATVTGVAVKEKSGALVTVTVIVGVGLILPGALAFMIA